MIAIIEDELVTQFLRDLGSQPGRRPAGAPAGAVSRNSRSRPTPSELLDPPFDDSDRPDPARPPSAGDAP